MNQHLFLKKKRHVYFHSENSSARMEREMLL